MASKTKGPALVAGSSYYVPAMSNAGVFKGYVIDPGSVGYEDIGRDDIHSVLITHGHNDHFRHAHEFRERGARVIAPKDDALLVRNPEVNVRGLFSWARPPKEMITPYFQGDACEVDLYIEDWLDSSIHAVWLPGHTLGEYGFITEDGVLYSADSLYSKELWGKYKLPYSIDPDLCRESLRIREFYELFNPDVDHGMRRQPLEHLRRRIPFFLFEIFHAYGLFFLLDLPLSLGYPLWYVQSLVAHQFHDDAPACKNDAALKNGVTC